jgi:CHAD domain-containing protein
LTGLSDNPTTPRSECWPIHESGCGKLERVVGTAPRLDRSIPRRATPGRFVVHLIESGHAKLVENELLMHADPSDERAVHQARVATRTLRSNLRAFRPFLDRATTDALGDEMRWLARLLGEVRDLHVMRRHLEVASEAVGGDREALVPILALVDDEVAFERRNLDSALSGDRHAALMDQLRALIVEPPVRDTVDDRTSARREVEKLREKRRKQLRRALDELGRDTAEGELHSHRKKIKRVRYAVQAGAEHRPSTSSKLEATGEGAGLTRPAARCDGRSRMAGRTPLGPRRRCCVPRRSDRPTDGRDVQRPTCRVAPAVEEGTARASLTPSVGGHTRWVCHQAATALRAQ